MEQLVFPFHRASIGVWLEGEGRRPPQGFARATSEAVIVDSFHFIWLSMSNGPRATKGSTDRIMN